MRDIEDAVVYSVTCILLLTVHGTNTCILAISSTVCEFIWKMYIVNCLINVPSNDH